MLAYHIDCIRSVFLGAVQANKKRRGGGKMELPQKITNSLCFLYYIVLWYKVSFPWKLKWMYAVSFFYTMDSRIIR